MRFRSTAFIVVIFAVSMAYLESAVVVYLQRALSVTPQDLFPLRGPETVGDLAAIEVGRELATLAMLAAVGWLAGRQPLERLAWTAIAFGVWDIAYYGWLWVFVGWPSAPGTWDVLFLIPIPWAGPVWAPVAVSAALIGFGLVAAREMSRGRPVLVGPRDVALALTGGVFVIASFVADAPRLMDGGLPGWYPWPLFLVGMVLAVIASMSVLRRGAEGGGPAASRK
jgi:hypothetical protein